MRGQQQRTNPCREPPPPHSYPGPSRVVPLPAARKALGAAGVNPTATAPKDRRPRPAARRAAATPPCCPSEPGSGRADWLANAQRPGKRARLRRSAAARAGEPCPPLPVTPTTPRRRSLGSSSSPSDLPVAAEMPKGQGGKLEPAMAVAMAVGGQLPGQQTSPSPLQTSSES